MNRLNKKVKWLFIILMILVSSGVGIGIWLFHDLPSIDEMNGRLIPPTVRIVDRAGRPLYDIIDGESGRHTLLAFDQIPLALRQATIATEDKSFYQNPGFDVQGIARALWINLNGGEVLAGGSTITQQVTRNLLLDAEERSEISVRRKLRESWLAWRITRTFSKDEILALYLNEMYYGGMAYGVEAAAQTYFGKSATQLTLAESATLAGLPQSPAVYNPLLAPEAAKARQQVVLELMVKEGYIDQDAYTLAMREPLFYAAAPYPVEAAHFVMMVQSELDRLFPQELRYESGGLTVRTTLDLNWQTHAENIIREQIYRLNNPLNGGPGHFARNAALVAIDPNTGHVRAMVGNPDYFDAEANGAVNMALVPRQPGSALKPIVYATALDPKSERPWTPATVLYDVRTVFLTHEAEPYVPVNFSRGENGPVLLRQALASSLNIPAVATLDAVGVGTAMGLAEDMGINTLGQPNEYDLSFALGGGPVRLFDLTTAYAAFANGGFRITPSLILDVTDAAGNVVYVPETAVSIRVLDERVAWLISNILSDNSARVLSFGPNSILQIDRTAAVKTGTTNDYHDNWTVGFTPDVVVGVWVGNANNEPMRGVTGVSGAGPIWHYFMRTILAGQPDQAFVQPPGLVQVEVCALSGLLPTADCPYRRWEWFIDGTQPIMTDTYYRRMTLDSRTGLLANAQTQPEERVQQVVLDLPPVLHAWAREESLTLLDDLLLAQEAGMETAVAPLRLISPDQNTTYRLSPTLPASAQQLHFEAVSTANLRRITIWLDGQPLAEVAEPPYDLWWPLAVGTHTVWAEGMLADGSTVASEPVTFKVVDGVSEVVGGGG
jgi:1A family penicillin-binding protein